MEHQITLSEPSDVNPVGRQSIEKMGTVWDFLEVIRG